MSAVFSPISLGQAERPKSQLGTYFVQTWGCQMNEEDSEQMALYLEQIGFTPVDSIHAAQVVLLNTCSVRKKPEDKAFSMLGELAIRKRTNPDMVIGVCGCMAQLRSKEIHQRAPHVDFVVGTGNLSDIPMLVQEALLDRKFQSRLELPERKGSIVTDLPVRHVRREGKLRAFVPIQYGCDKFCTFCIVPTTRGRERSRPTEEIIDEVKRLADAGTKEVTLLGQTVNSYGKNLADGKVPFSELLYLVSQVSGIERIRFTSPYPRDFKSDVIEAIRDIPQVMEHLHMPIQAGTNSELQRMKRLYTVESFREIVEEARSKIPNVSVSTDVIVGFPGETEEEFEGTLSTMCDMKFDFAYMFAYSPRPGTPAGDWEGQIDPVVKRARLNTLIDLQTEITEAQNQTKVGEVLEVLFDSKLGRKPGWLAGFTRCMRNLEVEANEERIGRIAN
ncbi:MAG TPA: tRNA (N6-isopentenyl adenosine(37)-C2)-methylthiotransferase MiaB, partial [Fimbriimonas sp.]|nr:tRNA (N6-isopentenyl adenosine(37)-C2)-methylthiotransferase MiaB [Fimbriimonas sp.]